MLQRRLAISPRFLLTTLLLCAAYWIVAAETEFSPLVPHSTFGQRVGDCATLWTILCAMYIGVMMLRKRPFPENSRVWPTTLVPILAGLWESALEVQERWADLSHPLSGLVASWRTTAVIMMIAPLAMGAMGGGFLFIVAWTWRRMHRPGTCYGCGYDLRGNTSHRCPECGLQLGGDEDKGWPFFRSCPEVLLFETAAERDAACRDMPRRIRKSSAWWASVFVAAMIAVCAATGYLSGRYCTGEATRHFRFWVGMPMFVLIFLVASHTNNRIKRRALRQILIEQGIRVCLHCGQDLRDAGGDMCPKCHRPSPPAIAPSPPAQSPQPTEKA